MYKNCLIWCKFVASSVSIEPVVGYGVRGCERHFAVVGVLHAAHHEFGEHFGFGGHYIEVKFVVHLKYHLRFQAALLHLGIER